MNVKLPRIPARVAGALARLAILLGLFFGMFRPELHRIASGVTGSAEQVHALLIPLMIVFMVHQRRSPLAEGLSKGSLWGVALISVGLLLYAAATWPFDYGYARDVAMLPVLAGLVLAACGWRALKLALPMLLPVMLGIPIGSRIYARLIIRPETYTIKAVALVLAGLPGLDAVVKGVDIFFASNVASGVVALGQSNRGATLLAAFATIGVFVAFGRIRSFGRLLWLALVGVPVILFCNFSRLLCWALLDVYVRPDPTGPVGRNISAVFSLLLAYGLFALAASARLNLFARVDEDTSAPEIAHE
jgi:hypothetical protein